MKSRSALLLAALVGLSFSRLLAEDVLLVRSSPHMPYNGGPGDRPGVIIEILCLIAGETGAAVDYAPMPWPDAVATVHAGKADAIIGATARDAGDQLLLPVETIGALHTGLFVRNDLAWNFENIRSLDSRRIGAIKGRTYGQELDQYLADHAATVTWFEGNNALGAAIVALRDGRIDVLPEHVSTFLWRARQMRATASYRLAHRDEGVPLHVAFSPTARGRLWAQRFDEGLRLLRADGTLACLLAEYGLTDWKQPAPDAAAPLPIVAAAAPSGLR